MSTQKTKEMIERETEKKRGEREYIPDGDDDEHFGSLRIIMEGFRNSVQESETSHFRRFQAFGAQIRSRKSTKYRERSRRRRRRRRKKGKLQGEI